MPRAWPRRTPPHCVEYGVEQPLDYSNVQCICPLPWQLAHVDLIRVNPCKQLHVLVRVPDALLPNRLFCLVPPDVPDSS